MRIFILLTTSLFLNQCYGVQVPNGCSDYFWQLTSDEGGVGQDEAIVKHIRQQVKEWEQPTWLP